GDIDVAGQGGTGFFANKALQCSSRGGVALVVFNNVSGPIGAVLAPSQIPVVTISREDGLHLRDDLGFESAAFGALSNFPIRLNPNDLSAFSPDTAGFSCKGPNNDFLVVKPDFIAPGEAILMAGALLSGEPTRYGSASGTSFSTPHAAGTAALIRDPDFGRTDFTPGMVRAALMNSATNHRLGDGVTPIPEDHRLFLHETGAGLVEMVRATSIGTLMGTNELNGTGGPDDATDPDFLPSYSFGELGLIGTGLAASDPAQQRRITVTLADVGGGGGTFSLGIVDAGALRGDVTRPVDTPGFSVALSAPSVSVPAGGSATFDLSIAVDGTASGLQIAGADDDGLEGTDLAWLVTASGPGGEELRMPFFVRAAPGAANQAPEARDDAASTLRDEPVVIAVLANDSDPEGQPLEVSSVSQPGNGTAGANADGTITYTPDPGFLGTDSFTYTASDGALEDPATVTVDVVACPPSTSGSFADDFEPGAEPGWTFNTAVNETPTSLTWRVAPDAFAQTLVNAMFSDASAPVGIKDDRLVSPPQDLSASSRLVFWHRFAFEPGFDGGVLEVSRDGGATWVDVVAGGGFFVAGGYNGVISPSDQSPIAGRAAWTGNSQFINAMNRVEVDLGAFAGLDVLVRWRLATDPVVPGQGWRVDDVQFTNLQEPATECNLAPEAADDHAVTTRDSAIDIDVLANDTDPDGDALTVSGATQPSHGSAEIDADGSVIYAPEAGFTGEDSFTYTASDGSLTD
ncbi:MAG: Ig-like domain-containing protein, partial [Actinobacteria bacterium]|nr:Ig-like domain-containing protein [Actinomycetota bacterium]